MDNTNFDLRNNVFNVLEKFVCNMYNIKPVEIVNEARYLIKPTIYIKQSFNKEFKNYNPSKPIL